MSADDRPGWRQLRLLDYRQMALFSKTPSQKTEFKKPLTYTNAAALQQQWRHKIVVQGSLPRLEEEIVSLGQEGWEVVNVFPDQSSTYVAALKQPLYTL